MAASRTDNSPFRGALPPGFLYALHALATVQIENKF